MKKNKGFALIELLTVIAILAVILLIAAPTILGVLDKAKKNTFKNQVLMYVEGLKNQVALSEIGEDEGITWTNNEAIVDFSSINMDSSNNYTGKIKVVRNNGKYTYTVIDAHGDGYKLDSQLKPEEITDSNIIADDKKQVQEYTITNMVINGSFENGNKNWEVIHEDSSGFFDFYSKGEVSNDNSYFGTHSYLITPTDNNAEYSYIYFKTDSKEIRGIDFVEGHVYYSSTYYLSKNNQTELCIHSADWNSGGYLYVSYGPELDTWSKVSMYFKPEKSRTAFIRVTNYNSKKYSESYFDGVILVDLTETFGAGNEPTKEWCDKNISYFDGTTKIYK